MTYTVNEIRRSGGIDSKGVRKYERVFRVYNDDPSTARYDGPLLISSHIPAVRYEIYNLGSGEVDLSAYLKDWEITPISGQLGMWECRLVYDNDRLPTDLKGSQATTPEQASSNTSPDVRPWVLKYGSVTRSELKTKDVNDKKATNSAGVPFSTGLQVPVTFPTISFSLYKATFDPEKLLYINSVNDNDYVTSYFTVLQRQGRITSYTADRVYEFGSFWWQIGITIEINFDKYNPIKILDAGTLYKASLTKPLQPILDKLNGNPVTQPVPLDGAGLPLNAGDPLVFIDFDCYEELDWSALI